MRMSPLLLFASLIALYGSAVRADEVGPVAPAREADKAAMIRALLHDAPPVEVYDFFDEVTGQPVSRPEWVAWCERFDADFRLQRGIEYVEPVAKAKRYDDPVFRPWQDRCPLLALNARSISVVPNRGTWKPRDRWVDALPTHLPDGSELQDLQFGTRDFKMYEGDYDNDPLDYNTLDAIFFADSYYSYWELLAEDERFPLAYPPLDRNWNELMPPHEVPDTIRRYITGEYRYLGYDRYGGICLTATLFQPESPYYWARKDLESDARHLINGLIRYRAQYYLFDLQSGSLAQPETDHSFSLQLAAILPRSPPDRHSLREIEGPPTCWLTPQ